MGNIHESGKPDRTSGLGPEDKRRDPPGRPNKAIMRQVKDGIGNSEKAGVDSAHVSHKPKHGKHRRG